MKKHTQTLTEAIESLKTRLSDDPLGIFWLNTIIEIYENQTARELAERMVTNVYHRDSSINSFEIDIFNGVDCYVVKAEKIK
jgi:hypothetical protein